VTTLFGGASTSRRPYDLDSLVCASRPGWRAVASHAPLMVTVAVVVVLCCQLRWSLASVTAWQCDEIPLLVRFTGLCGHVTNEEQARAFEPSFYTFYMGAMRSLRAPHTIATIHTTTGFWVNLTTHVFGVTPAAGRIVPMLWSIAAIGAAAWGGWLVVRSVPGACIAALLAALSPHATAYAAQARGYAEAMALAPLLLIALEYFRRRPDRWLRAVLVLVCAIELSLTVYTMWVYWVAPSLLLGLLILPRTGPTRQDGRVIRTVMVVTAVSVCVLMTFYTIDRWRQLTFTASHMGLRLTSWHDAWLFVRDTAAHVMAVPTATAVLAAVGLLAMWRSDVRWWLALIGAGVLVPAGLAAVNGSAGYPRNFGYVVVPIAVLGGAGADAVITRMMRRARVVAVSGVAAAAVLAGSAWVSTDVASRVRGIMLPDWGGAVMTLDRRAETVGPRWFCPCVVNHWQLGWYGDRGAMERCVAVAPGGDIEVVMGTQSDASGRETVFQGDPAAGAIVGGPVPAWLDAVEVDETICGVALRRWRGTRVDVDDAIGAQGTEPLLLLVPLSNRTHTGDIDADFKRTAIGAESITFKPVRVGDDVVWSVLVPGRLGSSILAPLLAATGARATDIHWFVLTHPVDTP
ncbi:MAG: hypothetical protein ACE5E6_06060, partial [Phycisphaerae bacterium]